MKELDNGYEVGQKDDGEREAYRLRQLRHQEITEEIKALAAQKKNHDEEAESSGR